MGNKPTLHPPRTARRALRLIGWNALLLFAGLALIGLAGEAWLRATVPFLLSHRPTVFVPGVGLLLRPDTEVRYTNRLDFWTVSRTNSLGFLDREPPSPERAAQSCHVAMVGDSFVEANEVPIPEKFHVRFEEMAARELPALNVTTSAFGRRITGQIGQLAFYDEYVRPLRPRLVVLVFVPNDYVDNFPSWVQLRRKLDPDHLPYVSAARTEDGGFRLRPPDPDYQRFIHSRFHPAAIPPQWWTLIERKLRASWFLSWLHFKGSLLLYDIRVHEVAGRMDLSSWRPAQASPLDWSRPMSKGAVPTVRDLFAEGAGSQFYTEALAFTAFALNEFKKRAERDGAALAVLAPIQMSRVGDGPLARLNEMAAERSIPVIDQGDFIRRQGAGLHDARWAHDFHWNPAGHQWAAEALLEYLKRNQAICE